MRWRELTTLQWALALSIGAHGVLLTIRFVDPEAINRAFRDTPLEVILVNARGNEPPTEAQAIAQANLAGGGEAEKGRATSPLPSAATMQLGDAADDDEAEPAGALQLAIDVAEADSTAEPAREAPAEPAA